LREIVKHALEPVPQALLELVKKAAPPEAEIVPLAWAYEDEDYNIAIVMPDTVDRLEAREIEQNKERFAKAEKVEAWDGGA